MTSDTSNRRYELDWLRVLAILIVFVYHSSRFFNLGDWHVKNINTFVWVEIWNVFATRWMMPLFFIISGASLFHAIGKSSGWSRFYVDKVLRLMVPVLIGSVTHSALQIYLERITHGQFSGSFFSFLGVYGWAGDTDDPVAIVLKHDGDHTIRIQPRQTPHRIDQIWLSRFQHRIPNTAESIK